MLIDPTCHLPSKEERSLRVMSINLVFLRRSSYMYPPSHIVNSSKQSSKLIMHQHSPCGINVKLPLLSLAREIFKQYCRKVYIIQSSIIQSSAEIFVPQPSVKVTSSPFRVEGVFSTPALLSGST